MRGFLGVVILGGMFCAYWFGSAVALRMAPAHLPADSVQADQIAVTGFPMRFDIAVDRPALPARGWSADGLSLSLPSYWPFAATGTLSGPQELTWRGVDWRLDGPDMPVSFALTPGLELTMARLDARDLQLLGPVSGRLDSAALAVDKAGDPASRAVALDMAGLALGKMEIPRASLRAVLHMADAPRPPRVKQIDLSRAKITMAEITVTANGTLDRAPDGRLSGNLPLTVTNWRALLRMLQENGLVPADQAPILQMMAERLGQGDTLSLPLTLKDSVVSLGPLALLELGPL